MGLAVAVEINLKTLSAEKASVGNQFTQLLAPLLLFLSRTEALITKSPFFFKIRFWVLLSGRYNLGFEQFRARIRVEFERIVVLGFGERNWKDKLKLAVGFEL